MLHSKVSLFNCKNTFSNLIYHIKIVRMSFDCNCSSNIDNIRWLGLKMNSVPKTYTNYTVLVTFLWSTVRNFRSRHNFVNAFVILYTRVVHVFSRLITIAYFLSKNTNRNGLQVENCVALQRVPYLQKLCKTLNHLK